ncbi:MAG: tRNA (adenosine(37)-N6)-threonylcarbamoyltransferase complex dimerization subunit type 1 TsaB [bacterium]|nr:tRNA (adenosine(37)-N6)-threonylcarbamoyltransferase complex dimerization subunit type 1 TsaB [bacterium]
MNILCIETSASLCSVAVIKNDNIFFLDSSRSMAHSEILMELVIGCMKHANCKMDELNAIALSGGPGSYTGLRIGCSSAKGLCYGLNIPLIAIDTLQIIAYAARENNPNFKQYWAMVDARRMEVYHALFNHNLEQITPAISAILNATDFNPDNLSDSVMLCGDGAEKATEVLNMPDAKVIANAKSMCELAKQAYINSDFKDVAYFEPFYLKQANITVSKS